MNLSEILKDQTMVSIATVDASGQPHVRMFNHQFIIDSKICFATSNTNSTYAEINENPKVELMQFARAKYVRISGPVVIAEGQEKKVLKAKLAVENPKLVEMYTPAGFEEKIEVVYFDNPQVKVTDYTNREPIAVEIK